MISIGATNFSSQSLVNTAQVCASICAVIALLTYVSQHRTHSQTQCPSTKACLWRLASISGQLLSAARVRFPLTIRARDPSLPPYPAHQQEFSVVCRLLALSAWSFGLAGRHATVFRASFHSVPFLSVAYALHLWLSKRLVLDSAAHPKASSVSSAQNEVISLPVFVNAFTLATVITSGHALEVCSFLVLPARPHAP